MALSAHHLERIQSIMDEGPTSIADRQSPLRKRYQDTPGAAWVHDDARTVDAQVRANHPLHAHVVCGKEAPVDIPVSVHQAVGGESDFPCPGEILAAALASCLDSAIRLIANLKGIEIAHLEVEVSLGADVRGTLMMGENVPVGFQTASMKVVLKSAVDLPEPRLEALVDAAERSCVLLQTLRSPPPVQIERSFG